MKKAPSKESVFFSLSAASNASRLSVLYCAMLVASALMMRKAKA
jgi:hypothetical protein